MHVHADLVEVILKMLILKTNLAREAESLTLADPKPPDTIRNRISCDSLLVIRYQSSINSQNVRNIIISTMIADPQKETTHSLPPPEPRRHRATTLSNTTHGRETIRSKFGSAILTNTVNRIYDMDGDGHLDAIEQTMMKYDKNGDGQFSNAEIYQIIEEQLAIERKAGRMKLMIIGLSCFLSLLALSNLGTSFAAMFLSKELVADSKDGVMRVQGTGDLAAVQSAAETLDLTPLSPEEYQERKLMVLRDLELDPHSHTHRRLKRKNNKDSKCKNDLCDGDILFDNGKMKEKDFRAIEEKCKQQKNVKIRRAKEFDLQADSICSAGTSVIVKEKKGGKEKEYKEKSQRVGNKNYKGKDREVMIRTGGKSMNVDCVGDNW